MIKRRDAAVLLVGNELLSGRVRDENLPFLAAELWALGVAVRHAEVCRDDQDDIAAAVRRLAPAHTWLFTTGGIGPTHDDVTVRGIARAFDRDVVLAPRLEGLIRQRFGPSVRAAHLRMAEIPRGGVLEGGDDGHWPTVRIENVFVLPGIPSILQRKFARLAEFFRQSPLHRRSIGFAVEETDLAPVLERAASDFPAVDIGSYPGRGRVLVTFEGPDEQQVAEAAARVDRETADWARAT